MPIVSLFLTFLHCSPILMAYCKIFDVTANLKIKFALAAAEELTNLRSTVNYSKSK